MIKILGILWLKLGMLFQLKSNYGLNKRSASPSTLNKIMIETMIKIQDIL